MAKKTLGSLLVRLGMDPSDADRAIKKLEKDLKKFEKNVTDIGQKMSIGISAPFMALMAKSVMAFDEEARAARSLQLALGGTSQALSDQAKQIERLMNIQGDQITGQQALLANLGRTETQIHGIIGAADDMSFALGMSLEDAVKGVNQTLNGTAGQLGKLLPELKNFTAEELRNGAAVEYLTKKYDGFGEAMAYTGAGPLKAMEIGLGSVFTKIGESFMPIVVAFTDKIKSLTDWFSQLSEEQMQNALGWGMIAAAMGPILIMLPKIVRWFAFMLSPVVIITGAFVALAGAIAVVVANWNGLVTAFSSSKMSRWPQLIQGLTSGNIAASMAAVTDGFTSVPTAPAPEPKGLGIGSGIFDLLGGEAGQKRLDEMNRRIEEMITKMDQPIKPDTVGEIIAGTDRNTMDMGMGMIKAGWDIPESLGSRFGTDQDAIAKAQSNLPEAMPDMSWVQSADQILQNYTDTWEALGGAIGSAVSEMGSALMQGESFFKSFGKAALKMAADIAKAAIVEVFAKLVKKSAESGNIFGVVAGIAGGIAASGLISAALAKLSTPKLASGGLAYGPTMAMVGDNPNARIDPEVIAPLSKLRRELSGAGNSAVQQVVGIIRGSDIHLVTRMAQYNASRTGGPLITF